MPMNHLTTPFAQRLLTVAEYHRMAEAGIIKADEQVELLAGTILPMSPIGTRHTTCVKRTNRLFSMIVGEKAIVSVHDPILLSDTSEPEPDVALLAPPLEQYAHRHPGPEDVFLVVEVADSSLQKDRKLKLPLYAEAGIPEVWLVDLEADQIEVYSEPQGQQYRLRRLAQRGDQVSVAALATEVAVVDVLGPV
ncbi:MAG: Uma2 family endonuclease [Bacteroidetes bacterium]|nr:MAG: Uma2 family endonuclease [Bacteroidota bacterium]